MLLICGDSLFPSYSAGWKILLLYTTQSRSLEIEDCNLYEEEELVALMMKRRGGLKRPKPGDQHLIV
jgi:hypothetical protein